MPRSMKLRAGPRLNSGGGSGTTEVNVYGELAFIFHGTREKGTYAVGDQPWVTGPVTVVETLPAPAVVSGTAVFKNNGPVLPYSNRAVNGMQVNPGNIADTVLLGVPASDNKYGRYGQGYDSLSNQNPDSSSVALTYVAPLNRALQDISGLTDAYLAKGISSTAEPMTRPSLGLLTDLAGVTVVSQRPLANSFRPPQAWSDKTAHWQTSMVDRSFLPALASPAGVTIPTAASLLPMLERPWNWGCTDNTGGGRTINAANNQPNYGQEIAQLIGSAMLLLCLASTSAGDKIALQNALVQQGLDLYGRISAGNLGEFYQLGGGNSGPPFLLAFTARSLQGAPYADDMLDRLDAEYNAEKWCEYGQHFLVTPKNTRIRPGPFGTRPLSKYLHYMVGAPEWTQTAYSADGAGYNFDATYRSIVASAIFGCLIAARVMGLLPSMNYPTMEAYYDRYRNWIEVEPEGANAIPDFHREFYDTHRGTIYVGAPTRTGVFAKDNQVWAEFSQQLDMASKPTTADVTVTVNGSPVTVSSLDIYSDCFAAILAVPLVGGETVNMAYAAGTPRLRNLSAVNASAFSAAAVNTTGEYPEPFTEAEMTYNNGTARSVLQWPLDQNKGTLAATGQTAWIIFGIKVEFPTVVAGGKVFGVASNGPCHLRTISATQIELLLSATSRCRFRPSAANFNPTTSDGPQILFFAVDMSKLDKPSGGMKAVINDVVQDTSTSEYTFNSTSGSFRFSLTQIWPSDVGVGAAQDGTSQSNVGIEYLYIAHGTDSADMPDINDAEVRAAMATGSIGGNGENISGKVEFGFWAFTADAANSAEGIINRAAQVDLPILPAVGTWTA